MFCCDERNVEGLVALLIGKIEGIPSSLIEQARSRHNRRALN